MMSFIVKVLSNAFEKEDIPKLEEEVSRLFRSNAFNISTRTQFDEQRKKKYPQLKEAGASDKIDEIVKRMEHRLKVPKESHRQSYLKSKTEIRPLFSRLTSYGAINSRSPLVSMIFPSMRDKMKIFQEEQLKKEPQTGPKTNSSYVKRAELEKIVEQETKRRNPSQFN